MSFLKNNLIYNFGKEIYYRYFYFKDVPHKWDGNIVRTIYNGVPIKFFLYSVKNKDFKGPKYLNENLGTLHREIPGYLALRDVQEGDVILDCGAYNGSFAVYACKKAGKNGKVICFEPDKRNVEILKKNLELNNCKNYEIIQKGLWDKKTKLKFKSGGIGAMLSPRGDVIVNTITIDSELKKLKIPLSRVNFVKMDIEGAEIKALGGAKKLLSQKKKPYIAIASYHLVNGRKTCYEVEKQLKKYGYKIVKSVFPKHLVTIGKNE